MTIRYLIALIYFLPALLFAQNQEKLTASQIVDSSLVFCGGEARISKINSVQTTYFLIQPDESTAIINNKLKTGEKFVQCILSKTNSPQTTFFDGEKISRVDGNSVVHVTDIQSKEEVKLRTYSLIQYGYKKLNYELSRLPDHKFENADCFVVTARAPNGYTTKNFFDKKNYRLIMVMYPNGNRSIMMDYIFKDGVLFNSKVGNGFANSDGIQVLKLLGINLNVDISNLWFNCPYSDKVDIPEYIRTGRFVSTNGPATTFNRNQISMDYTDNEGKIELRRFLWWNFVSADTFYLKDEQEVKNNDKSSSSEILVRIVSWDEHGYVCQWITDNNTDTQDYKLIK